MGLITWISVSESTFFSKPQLKFEVSSNRGVAVDQVRVCHIAHYKSSHHEEVHLDVVMWQDTYLAVEISEEPSKDTRTINVTASRKAARRGLANTWYEASLSSRNLEMAFKENEMMEFGDESQWTVNELKENGSFENLYSTAVRMIERIDCIGDVNDNGWNTFRVENKKVENRAPILLGDERLSSDSPQFVPQMDW